MKRSLRTTCGLLIVLLAGPSLFAQETHDDANRSSEDHPYAELAQSEDRTTRMLVERYENLVKLQEWRDASGKARIHARYVEHDPGLEWVKLAVVQGSGENRVIKEGTVPLDKLNKSCQSRVRQIDTLQAKLAELQGAATPGDPSYGTIEQPDAHGTSASEFEPSTTTRPAADSASAAEPFEVDPLGFAEMDLTPIAPGTPQEFTVAPGAPAVPPGIDDPARSPEATFDPNQQQR